MILNHPASPSLAHLFTLSAGIGSSDDTGDGAAGRRVRDSVGEGTFAGERLRGELLPGSADWRLIRRDITSIVDARVMLRTDDGALIYMSYGGRIVNIASIAGKEGNPNAAHYSASKAGLIALTKSLGKELAAHDILVNAVTPAAAKTAIFNQITQQHIDFMLSKIPKNRFVRVEELAAMVAWLASEDCAFSTGAVFDISGGRATY